MGSVPLLVLVEVLSKNGTFIIGCARRVAVRRTGPKRELAGLGTFFVAHAEHAGGKVQRLPHRQLSYMVVDLHISCTFWQTLPAPHPKMSACHSCMCELGKLQIHS